MVKVKKEGIILRPTKLYFENKGVFNPACIREGDYVHMFYRAWDKKNRSSIGYCKLKGPLKVVERSEKPIMAPEKNEQGLEDPRIVKIDDTYYLTFIVYDGKSVAIAYSTSKDLKTFSKKKIISPMMTYDKAEDLFRQCKSKLKERYFLFESYFKDVAGKNALLWDKDAFFFPEKINGKFVLVHRILPDIQIAYFKNFKSLTKTYWKKYYKELCKHILLESKHWYETRNVGGGCPPIKTDNGWIFVYHAVDDMDKGKTYRAGVALLNKKNPQKIIGHHHEPLFSPTEKWELKGNVDNVVFPTGSAIFGKKLYIYYGAADKFVAVASMDINKLLKELLNPKKMIYR